MRLTVLVVMLHTTAQLNSNSYALVCNTSHMHMQSYHTQLVIPSFIFPSSSSMVGSISSQPSGGGFRLLLTFGMMFIQLVNLRNNNSYTGPEIWPTLGSYQKVWADLVF